MDIEKNYLRWCECAKDDSDLTAELAEMSGNPEAIEDAFYRELDSELAVFAVSSEPALTG